MPSPRESALLPSPDVWEHVQSVVKVTVVEELDKRESSRREWLKTWIIVLGFVTALGIWQVFFHLPDTTSASIDAWKKNADDTLKKLDDRLGDLNHQLDDLKQRKEQALDEIDLRRKEINSSSKEAAEVLSNFRSTQKSIVDTTLSAGSLVPRSAWESLALPVGTILYVDPLVAEALTGRPNAWWHDPSILKDWSDQALRWVPLIDGQVYGGSRYDQLRGPSPMVYTRVGETLKAFAGKADYRGVLLIRINGPNP